MQAKRFLLFSCKVSLVLMAVSCTYISPYKGTYNSPAGAKGSLVLEANGTGYSLTGSGEKLPLIWDDPISNHETGLKDNTGYDYCYITYTNSDKTETVFFDPTIRKNGLFTVTLDDQSVPTLMLIGIKQ